MSNKKVIIIISIFLISFFSTGLRAASVAPLTVTINQAPGQADPTNSSPINFEVVFSESVNDFTNENVAIGGTAGATTAVVTGSGTTNTTYNVAVSGMKSSGTVIARIDAGKAHDVAGNPNTASSSTDNIVAYDITAPTVTITSTATSPTKNSPIPMTATFSKTVIGFSLSSITVGNGAASNLQGNGTVYTFDVTPSGQGTVTVNIPAGAAHDEAGNVNTAATQFSVIYDSIQPTITISSPSNNTLLNTSTVAVSGTASDSGSGLQKVEVSVDSGTFAAATVTGTSWTFTASALPDGPHTITAKATDNAGNPAETSISITVDTALPSIAITSPSNNAFLNTSIVTVSGTASKTGSGLQKVEVSVDGGSFSIATGTTSWSFATSALSDGPHTITAKATDNAGNTKEASISISVDASPPAINITSPADGHVFIASPVTIIGTASDNIGLSKVKVKVGTGDWQPASGTNSWNATVTLSEGSNTIYAQATDTSGNIQQTSITVTVVSAPSIDNVRALTISNSSIKVVWATNQSDLNIVRYGYKPALEDGIWSSWNNNTSNPDIIIDGLKGQPVYYQVFSYNASNSSAYSNSSIFKFVYPLQVTMYYIEPAITNGNETWISASSGHVGKFIGVDGNLNNTGEDSLTLAITSTNFCAEPCILPLAKGNRSFMETLGRYSFEINSTEVKDGFFNTTMQIKVMGQNGSWKYNYTNITTISLKMNPLLKIKRATGRDGKDIRLGQPITVLEGSTTTINYILEANSSVNLTDVYIYDPFYPANQGVFHIQKLEANKPQNVSYTYKATTSDLSSNKCGVPVPCIINLAKFNAEIESSGEQIKDSDYMRLWVFPYVASSGGGGSSSSGGGGGGGGMAPSEDINNIERREIREMDVLFRAASTYVFRSADPVMVVAFESSVSENGVPVSVEVLKNRSKNIKEDAPGKPYKYFNVFVGTSGFSQKVSKGVIAYRVNNSWLKENDIDPADISLYKWRGTWVKLDTEIAENRSNYTYYASLTGNFSSFAIAAAKDQRIGGAYVSVPDIPAPPDQQNTTQAIANLSADEPKHKIPGLSAAAILAFGIADIIFYLKRNYKKLNKKEVGK